MVRDWLSCIISAVNAVIFRICCLCFNHAFQVNLIGLGDGIKRCMHISFLANNSTQIATKKLSKVGIPSLL